MSAKASILVVDDDEDIRETLAGALEEEGYEVTLARHGRAAIEHLATSDTLPQLIILDIMMDIMDGRTFLEVLHRDYPNSLGTIPILITSASRSQSEIPPNTRFLRKPFDLETLLEQVERAIAASRR
jgi:CheY-like chemotaxis protein